MKNILRSVSAVLAALLLAANCIACNNAKSDPPVTTTTQTAATTATVISDGTTTLPPVTDEPPVTEPGTTPPKTDPPPPETEPLPPEPATYPAWEGRADVELLASPDSTLGDVMSISAHGEKILLSYAQSDPEGMAFTAARAIVLDTVTGRLSDPIELSDTNRVAVYLDSGNVCVYDQLACIAEVYSSDGKKQYTFVSQNTSVGFYLDSTGNGTLWTYSWDSPTLTKVPLSGKPAETFDLPVGEGGYIMGQRDGILYYSAWDGVSESIYAIDEAGEVTHLPMAEGFYWGGNCLFTDTAPNRILDPTHPEQFYQIDSENAFAWVAAGSGTQLLVEVYGETDEDGVIRSDYRVLDYEKGVYYPALPTDPDRFYYPFLFAENDTLYFLTGRYDDNGQLTEAELCRWSYAHDAEPVEVERLAFETLELEIASIARRINEAWGVKVYYQPDLIHLVASDYSAAAVTDLQVLYEHILQLEAALAAYPSGFFDDLCYGDFTHLEIYLCGKFTPLTPDGITTAEALANTRGSAMVIGVNVEYLDGEYVRVLAHELLHIMERRIDQIDIDILGEWVTLTPGGHDAYYYSYHDENGHEMNDVTHTYYFEDDPANAYFVDAYSKSFPTEDRARIFEKLMESGGNPYFADSPVLMAKARALCKVIRENFPSVAAAERASWEVE